MKTIRVFYAVVLIFLGLTQSQPSQAVVALASGGSAMVGLTVIAYGTTGVVASTVLGTVLRHSGDDAVRALTGVWYVSAAATLAGVVILDGGSQIVFQPINQESGTKVGLSEEERLSFNEEIDQANTLLAAVEEDLEKIEKPTDQDFVNAWNQVKDLVHPLTFSAMVKIASQKK
jgi:hypothetical protein